MTFRNVLQVPFKTQSSAHFMILAMFIFFFNVPGHSADEKAGPALGRRMALQRMGAGVLGGAAKVAGVAPANPEADLAAQIQALEDQLAAALAAQNQLSGWIDHAIETAGGNHFQKFRNPFMENRPVRGFELSTSTLPNGVLDWRISIGAYHRSGDPIFAGKQKSIDLILDWVRQNPQESAAVQPQVQSLISKLMDFDEFEKVGARDTQSLTKSYEIANLAEQVLPAIQSEPWRSLNWYDVFKDRLAKTMRKLAVSYNIPMNMMGHILGLLAQPSPFSVCYYTIGPLHQMMTQEFLSALIAEVKTYSPAAAEQISHNYLLDRAAFDQELKSILMARYSAVPLNSDELTKKQAAYRAAHIQHKQIGRVNATRHVLLFEISIILHDNMGITLDRELQPRGPDSYFVQFSEFDVINGNDSRPVRQALTQAEDEYLQWGKAILSSAPNSLYPIDIAFEKLNTALNRLNKVLAEIQTLPDTDIRYAWLEVGAALRNEILFEIRALPRKHQAYKQVVAKIRSASHPDIQSQQAYNAEVLARLPSPHSPKWLNPLAVSAHDTILEQRWLSFLSSRQIDLSPLKGIYETLSASARPLAALASTINTSIINNHLPITPSQANTVETPTNMSDILKLVSQPDEMDENNHAAGELPQCEDLFTSL